MPNPNAFAVWIGECLLGGLAAHVAVTVRNRRTYAGLRRDYTDALTEAQRSASAEAIVRTEELRRGFARAVPPVWFAGLAAHLKAAFLVAGLLGGGLLVLAGRLPPAIAGLALLFLLGLRRILRAAALLLAVFVASSLLSPPHSAFRSPALVRSTHPHTVRAQATSR